MLKRYTPLKRTPIRKKRKGPPRPGRLDAAGVQAQRVRIFERDKGICEDCKRPTIFNAPEEWPNSFHRAHRRGKRMWKDEDSNVKTSCGDCHRKHHTGGKVVPPKVKP